jgi:hypothetical protein
MYGVTMYPTFSTYMFQNVQTLISANDYSLSIGEEFQNKI